MTWYRTGTVAVTANNNTVTGTGTQFSANVRVGDAFIGPDGRIYEVTNVASNTVLSIAPNYRGSTATGQQYAIAPVQGYQKRLADRAAELIDEIGDIPGEVDQLQEDVATKAPINSPAFTGTPTAPNPSNTDDSTRVQTTSGSLNQMRRFGIGQTGSNPISSLTDATIPNGFYSVRPETVGSSPDGSLGTLIYNRNVPDYITLIYQNRAGGATFVASMGDPTDWKKLAWSPAAGTNASTTASAANVFVGTNDMLLRSTSSAKYKTQVEDIEPDRAEQVLDFRPVWYRSTCDADRPDWGWYGLIAEEVGEIAPQFVHWAYPKKTVQRSREIEVEVETGEFDDDGKPITRRETKTETWTEEVDDVDAGLQAEGVMYDRLVVPLLWHVKKQRQRIEALETDLAAVQARLDALEDGNA